MTEAAPRPPRLMRTVSPFPGEDIRSVAVRYAGLKRLTVGDLMVAGLRSEERALASLPLRPALAGAFAELAGHDAASLVGASFGMGEAGLEIFGSRAGIDLLVPHWRRLAPGMLRSDGDAPWIRAHWQVACLPCDPDTGETLHHLCPGCCATLSWMWVKAVHRCDRCGIDLRECEPAYASKHDRDLSALMVGVLRRDPSALDRLPSVIRPTSLAEQLDLFAWLGSLRPLVNGVIAPDGPFATYRGLEEALAYPASVNRMVGDLMAAHEERDPRFGRLVGALEMRARVGKLMPGRIRTAIRQRVDKLTGQDVAKGMKVTSGQGRGAHAGALSIRLDYPAFLLSSRPTIDARHRALSGLGDRQILLAP